MKKIILWLFLILTSFPASADPLDTSVGNPEQYVRPPAIKFPTADSIPGCSIAAGYRALRFLPNNSPAPYCDIAIGYNTMIGKMTSTAVNNIGVGFQACEAITTGANNICLGVGSITPLAGPGASITTGSRNMFFGSGAGANYTTGNDQIIFESEGSVSGSGSASNNVLIDTHGGWDGSNTVMLTADNAYQGGFACNYITLDGYSSGRLNVCNGGAENNIILFGSGATAGTGTNDVATSTSNNAIGFGGAINLANGSHVGTLDTVMGFRALHTNAQDNAKQACMGFDCLFTSNVASAQNSAFGYQTGKLVTTGKNNVFGGYNAGSATLTTGSGNIILGSGLTTLAAGTAGEINIGGLVFNNNVSTAVPTLSGCGSGPSGTVESHSNSASGTITIGGTASTSCVVTFASAYASYNHCRVTSQTAIAAMTDSYTTAAITIGGTSLIGGVFDYVCDGV